MPSSPLTLYGAALLLTLALEIPVVAALHPGARARLAATCALATLCTHLFMHHALRLMVHDYTTWLVAGELIALSAEALAYLAMQRPRDPGRALLASALANTLSFGAGLIWIGA